MPLIADRFLRMKDGGDVVDLATAEMVRLTVDSDVLNTRERAMACDRLSGLRHPLLLPLVDYGMHGTRWFEAHARLPALGVPAVHATRTALHLVRFLRAGGVELDAGMSARIVRPAIEMPAAAWPPVGVFLQWRHLTDKEWLIEFIDRLMNLGACSLKRLYKPGLVFLFKLGLNGAGGPNEGH